MAIRWQCWSQEEAAAEDLNRPCFHVRSCVQTRDPERNDQKSSKASVGFRGETSSGAPRPQNQACPVSCVCAASVPVNLSVVFVGGTNGVVFVLLTFSPLTARPSLPPRLSALTPALHGNTLIQPCLPWRHVEMFQCSCNP